MRYALSPTLLVVAVLSSSIPVLGAEKGGGSKFIVHEWGAMVRGRSAQGTVLSGPKELLPELPDFVLRHEKAFVPRRQDHGWDKPVIHFYGPAGLAVKVQVQTPMGQPIAYWPRPQRFVEKQGPAIVSKKEMMVYTLTQALGMEWNGVLADAPKERLRSVEEGHWWSAVRRVPSSYLETAGGSERFVFYEATARQEPLLKGEVTAEALTLVNQADAATGPVLVIVNDGQSMWMGSVEEIGARAKVKLNRAELMGQKAGAEDLLGACSKQWRAMGMTVAEAEAIVETWKKDLLGTVGMLVISRMPMEAYEKMFPLKVEPKPQELVRVGMVFDTLPGQDARLGWLPGMGRVLEDLGKQLASDNFAQREEAAGKLEAMGDLARPFLEKLKSSPDAEVAHAAGILVKKLDGTEAK